CSTTRPPYNCAAHSAWASAKNAGAVCVQPFAARGNCLVRTCYGEPVTDILFGQSYFLRFDPKLWDAMQPYPPLGTLYAASYIRDRGYQVALFDAMLAESEQEWDQALGREQPEYAVLYEDNFNYLSKMCLLRMRQAAFTMLGMARARGCITVAAGSDATDHAAEYMAAGANYVLLGEGEETLTELLDHTLRGADTRLE